MDSPQVQQPSREYQYVDVPFLRPVYSASSNSWVASRVTSSLRGAIGGLHGTTAEESVGECEFY